MAEAPKKTTAQKIATEIEAEDSAPVIKNITVGGESEVFRRTGGSNQAFSSGDDELVFIDNGNEFTDLQLEDYTWRVKSRKNYARILIGLLLAQNSIVFGLVGYALIMGTIQDLQLIFGVLISATLVETAYMVRVIVVWMFKEINYPREN